MKSNSFQDEKVALFEASLESPPLQPLDTKEPIYNQSHHALRRHKSHTISLLFTFSLISIGFVLALHFLRVHGQIPQSLYTAYHLETARGAGSLTLLLPAAVALVYCLVWNRVNRRYTTVKHDSPYLGPVNSRQPLWYGIVDYVALSPVKAFRRRQWPAFAASAVTVLILWGLIPSQVGIFSRGYSRQNATIVLDLKNGYINLQQDPTIISKDTKVSVYQNSFQSSRPPVDPTHKAFATDRLAFMPFEVPENVELAKNGEIWTYPTTEYSMDLDCRTAEVTQLGTKQFWTSEFGCSVPRNVTVETQYEETSGTALSYQRKQYSASYASYDGGDTDISLSQYCPDAKTLMFATLAVTGPHENGDESRDTTAIFCKPKFYAEEVGAAVLMPMKEARTISRGAAKRELPPSDMFDGEQFMRELYQLQHVRYNSAGEPADNYQMLTWGDAFDFSKTADLKNSRPSIMTYALMASRHSLKYLSQDTERLAIAYQDIFQRYYASAIHERLNSAPGSMKTVEATRTYTTPSIVVDSTRAIVAETCLAAIMFLTLWLTWLTVKHPASNHFESTMFPETLRQQQGSRRYMVIPALAIITAFGLAYLYLEKNHLRRA